NWPIETASNNSYLPGPGLRKLLAIRQPLCARDACGRPAQTCETDHIVEYDPRRPADRQTVLANLQPLSKNCHQLKTQGGWRYQRDPATGQTTVTTALGFQHTTPASRLE
ncbi:MAG: HNH endonuclease, partial [Bifidobacteriaceae bacterium]|nr:HNH endonuclease [Bifidobacteriaceae bacterium]